MKTIILLITLLLATSVLAEKKLQVEDGILQAYLRNSQQYNDTALSQFLQTIRKHPKNYQKIDLDVSKDSWQNIDFADIGHSNALSMDINLSKNSISSLKNMRLLSYINLFINLGNTRPANGNALQGLQELYSLKIGSLAISFNGVDKQYYQNQFSPNNITKLITLALDYSNQNNLGSTASSLFQFSALQNMNSLELVINNAKVTDLQLVKNIPSSLQELAILAGNNNLVSLNELDHFPQGTDFTAFALDVSNNPLNSIHGIKALTKQNYLQELRLNLSQLKNLGKVDFDVLFYLNRLNNLEKLYLNLDEAEFNDQLVVSIGSWNNLVDVKFLANNCKNIHLNYFNEFRLLNKAESIVIQLDNQVFPNPDVGIFYPYANLPNLQNVQISLANTNVDPSKCFQLQNYLTQHLKKRHSNAQVDIFCLSHQ